MKNTRTWGRRITLGLLSLGVLLGGSSFVSCLAYSAVDSEVGVMMTGFPLLIGVTFGTPVVGLSTLLWGLGLKQARGAGEQIPRWEAWCFGCIALGAALLLGLLGPNYLHLAKSCAGV